MINNPKYPYFKSGKLIPIDEFFDKILYEPNKGYYSKNFPFGKNGDFITAPTISNLFSEIISIWIITTWEKLGKPNKFNFVELGPGDGSLTRVLLRTFKKFPNLYNSVNINLYERSNFLIKVQKNKLKESKVKWIKNFDNLNDGPIIFFGNEFFDAIPIKQFSYDKNSLFEKCYSIDPILGINEVFKKANLNDIKDIKKFKVFEKSKFIEFPKLGLLEMDKIVKKIEKLSGGILLIDYGYIKNTNKNTLQAVMKNKKIDKQSLFKNLGNADITSLVNFGLLKEYFIKNKLRVKKVVSQKFFLEKMGIIERAKILEKNMTFKEKDYMTSTLNRLLNKESMGELFKVIFAFKSKTNNFLGFK